MGVRYLKMSDAENSSASDTSKFPEHRTIMAILLVIVYMAGMGFYIYLHGWDCITHFYPVKVIPLILPIIQNKETRDNMVKFSFLIIAIGVEIYTPAPPLLYLAWCLKMKEYGLMLSPCIFWWSLLWYEHATIWQWNKDDSNWTTQNILLNHQNVETTILHNEICSENQIAIRVMQHMTGTAQNVVRLKDVLLDPFPSQTNAMQVVEDMERDVGHTTGNSLVVIFLIIANVMYRVFAVNERKISCVWECALLYYLHCQSMWRMCTLRMNPEKTWGEVETQDLINTVFILSGLMEMHRKFERILPFLLFAAVVHVLLQLGLDWKFSKTRTLQELSGLSEINVSTSCLAILFPIFDLWPKQSEEQKNKSVIYTCIGLCIIIPFTVFVQYKQYEIEKIKIDLQRDASPKAYLERGLNWVLNFDPYEAGDKVMNAAYSFSSKVGNGLRDICISSITKGTQVLSHIPWQICVSLLGGEWICKMLIWVVPICLIFWIILTFMQWIVIPYRKMRNETEKKRIQSEMSKLRQSIKQNQEMVDQSNENGFDLPEVETNLRQEKACLKVSQETLADLNQTDALQTIVETHPSLDVIPKITETASTVVSSGLNVATGGFSGGFKFIKKKVVCLLSGERRPILHRTPIETRDDEQKPNGKRVRDGNNIMSNKEQKKLKHDHGKDEMEISSDEESDKSSSVVLNLGSLTGKKRPNQVPTLTKAIEVPDNHPRCVKIYQRDTTFLNEAGDEVVIKKGTQCSRPLCRVVKCKVNEKSYARCDITSHDIVITHDEYIKGLQAEGNADDWLPSDEIQTAYKNMQKNIRRTRG